MEISKLQLTHVSVGRKWAKRGRTEKVGTDMNTFSLPKRAVKSSLLSLSKSDHGLVSFIVTV